MSTTKKSILIYLDNYPMLVSLPPEQRGWVLTALMVYGDRLCRDVNTALEEITAQFPQLSSEARVVCGFMGANILRDTQKWLSRQQFRGRAAPEKPRRGIPPSVPDPDETVRRNIELTRRALKQCREEV